ncbi:HCLS1-associated protein X-1, partial [Melanerpes formicivorus]|uniref:HCLS1-associated protein X-1 n=1 Tax=Melanerpes formicivorus TaxID=211600 RepID=UPI00358F4463
CSPARGQWLSGGGRERPRGGSPAGALRSRCATAAAGALRQLRFAAARPSSGALRQRRPSSGALRQRVPAVALCSSGALRQLRHAAAALYGRASLRRRAMSFYEAFRGFFGFPGRGRTKRMRMAPARRSLPRTSLSLSAPFPAAPSRSSSGTWANSWGSSEGAWAAAPQPFEPSLPGSGAGSAGRPLRDSMLKLPDGPGPAPAPARPWSPFPGLEGPGLAAPGPKEDGDLDCQVSRGGLGTILRPEEPRGSCYCRSVAVTQVTLPDGAVEERRTVQDSLGHRETTVRRHSGHQAPGTTPSQDGHCPQELLSEDHRELAQFVGTWPGQEQLQAPSLSLPPSALGTFLRRWLSSW